MSETFYAKKLFDGATLLEGPFRLQIDHGVFTAVDKILPGEVGEPCHDLVTPPLVESHAHLFLDGDELDFERRKTHLTGSFERMLTHGERNLAKYRECGITVIRDAGDNWGVNHALRGVAKTMGLTVISAGRALRRAGRYGSFMAQEISDASQIEPAVAAVAKEADTLKIVLSGIIDFAHGKMKGEPQFSLDELRLMTSCARNHGLKTFVHCSGSDALELAVAAQVDSIEHGFFMTNDLLKKMADQRIAWVPTIIPVMFQYQNPGYGNFDSATLSKLCAILDNHQHCLRLAETLKVTVMAGSDGGSFGVPHGKGLLTELGLMQAAGMSLEKVLDSAVNAPRRHFNLPPVWLKVNEKAAFGTLREAENAESGRERA